MKRTIESLTPPENKQAMWLDISGKIKQLKAYINGEWVVVNDDTENNEEIVKKVLEKIDKDFESYVKKEDADNTYATKTDLDNKADNVTFDNSIDGLVPSPDFNELDDPPTAVLNANGDWMQSYDASKPRTKRTFLAAPVDADGKADFRAITAKDLPNDINILDLMSYGISWKPTVGDPVVTRVGNMSYHKTLPIQNNMRGCIAQMKDGAKIMYFLDPTDWRWRENPRGSMLKDQALTVTENTYTLTNDIFSTLQYEHQWVKINNIPCEVISIDTTTKIATINPDSVIEAGTYDVELGAVLNGYDGEVMVLVPEFWIKSWDTETQREVRISPSKIDDTWEHQPRILIGAYHDTVLNTVPENMGYLSTLEASSALSIANIHRYCMGGNLDPAYNQYITSDRCRSLLGKTRTKISRAAMRNNCRRSGKEILSYLQYKRVLYWLYFIEYANFNCQAEFNSELTSEGFRQGGLGSGVTTISFDNWNKYIELNPLTPNGYTNEFGNRTNLKEMLITIPGVDGGESIIKDFESVPRWHGIENPFGDIETIVDGVIINPGSVVLNGITYNEVYATDNPSLYSGSDYSKMRLVGMSVCNTNPIKEWDLGDTAEIVPRTLGASITQFKCDCHYSSTFDSGLKQLTFGGSAWRGSNAGLGCSSSLGNIDYNYKDMGFRSSCVID